MKPHRAPPRNKGMMRTHSMLNTVFTRKLLKLAVADVRKYFPETKIGEAWVWTSDRKIWEFHGPGKFYVYFEAGNAFDARYKGWMKWLKHKGVI